MSSVLELLNIKDIIVPGVLIKYSKELNIDSKELLFLSLLFSYDHDIPFDMPIICNRLNLENMEVLQIISSLTEKKLLNMHVLKDEVGIMKEYFDISLIRNKLASLLVDKRVEEQEEKDTSDIYSNIEKEFGRTLSPIEYETIKHWLDSNISEEMIKDALKEAVLNGVNNLKYIDKILFEWKKKGYKKVNNKKEDESLVNLPDYNWLDEE